MKMSNWNLHLLVLATISFASPPDSLNLHGKIAIQGKKHIGPSESASSQTPNNLDSWWGRAVVSADYQTPQLQSFIEVYIYPSGFGVEPLVGATFEGDSLSGDSIRLETAEIDLFQLSNAWISVPLGPIHTKVGRFETFLGQGQGFFGDYIDENLYSGFNAKGAVHNGIDIYTTYGSFYSSVILQSGDENLNTGRIRLQQSYAQSIYSFDLAYRFNAFDFSRKANHASPEHRIHAAASIGSANSWLIYVEPATIATKDASDEYEFQKVVLVGTRIPTGGILDVTALEFEFVPDRKVLNDKGKLVDKPLLWNIQIGKSFLQYLNIGASIYSDPLGAELADLGFASRLTAQLW